MSLAERSVTSVAWNAGTNLSKVAVLLARSILLARLLPIETFGVYALATSIVTFSGILPMFGLGAAFLHRAPETADEEEAAAVHFTLRLLFVALWAAVLLAASYLFAESGLRLALIALTLLTAGLYLCDTPRMILTRRVEHRRLALLDLLTAVLTTVAAVALARMGYGLGALLVTDAVTLALAFVALYVWRPVWRPRLLWLPDTVRYYWRFGGRALAGTALGEALDNLDDIWIGSALGDRALGLYSRAYTFATYPRRVLAFPVNLVAGGTYAELKGDRPRLSRAFFRSNALLVRSGFLMGGLLVLVAPEFVRLALGERWLPMVPVFQIMAVFTLLDPIRVTVSQLFLAVGEPERVARVRLIQLVALVTGLAFFGRAWGIVGVAVIVDVVLLIGLIPLLVLARRHVDFSYMRLFFVPGLALLAGGAAAWLGQQVLCPAATCANDWFSGIIKAGLFGAIFCGLLLVLERRELLEMTGRIRQALRPARS